MPAPIVVEIVASPSASDDEARSLVASCSQAAGPGGCVLADPAQEALAARAHVVVSFLDGGASVRVEAAAPVGEGGSERREAFFHADDPRRERFRAAGLLAAGLVAERSPAPPVVPESTVREGLPPVDREALPARGRGVGWYAAALFGVSTTPHVGGWLGADLPLGASPLVASLSLAYEQRTGADAMGLSDARSSGGAGVGADAVLIPGSVDLAARVEVTVTSLRASVVEPATGQRDTGGRVLLGAVADLDLRIPAGSRAGLFAGWRGAWLGGDTTVRVHDAPAAVIGAWSSSLALGVDVRLP